jgi:hypothetical protein
MKEYLAFFAIGLVGAVVGAWIAGALYMRQLRVMIPSHLATLEQGQEHSCMLSLAALARLEAGDTERTKSILAQAVASFYHHPWQPHGAQRQKILEFIEAAQPNSTVLRDALSKTSMRWHTMRLTMRCCQPLHRVQPI